jgi:hypothetical protein
MKKICDIEVYPNYFLVGIKDYYSKEVITFQVSDWIDEREQFREWFESYDGFLITFNGIHYDEVVINYALKNSTKSVGVWLKEVFKLNERIINDTLEENEKWFKKKWISVDLMLYWSKKLRITKQISLKALGIQLGYPVVQELPYPPGTYLDQESIEKVYEYNTIHDLGISYLLAHSLADKIVLRKELGEMYKLNLWSSSPTSIASKVLLKKYCEKTGENPKEVSKIKYFPKPYLIGDYLPKVNFKTPFFQDLYKEIAKSGREFSKDFLYPVKNRNIKIQMGIGGLHSWQKDEVYTKGDRLLIDIDISSLYPRALSIYKFIREDLLSVLEVYDEITDQRIEYKNSGDISRSDGLKLIINSTTGLADTTSMWLYSPEYILALRVLGQLTLLYVVESLQDQEIISLNTDGVTFYCEEKDLEEIKSRINIIEKELGFNFEYEYFEWIRYKSVNSYIALSSKGKVKKKGSFFKTKPELGDGCNFLAIPKCLELYFVNRIRPEEVMKDPERYGLHIYDFCASKKVSKKFKVYWNSKEQQRINRYYASKKGAYLYRDSYHLLKESPVELLNIYEGQSVQNFNINYSFYLKKINEVINDLTIKPTLF